MKRVIYKQAITPSELLSLKLPKGATILTVQTQYGKPCIWFICDPDAEREERVFEIYGTGHELRGDKYNHQYIGTFQLEGGKLVFHLFELKAK